jgi:hypothetical protein
MAFEASLIPHIRRSESQFFPIDKIHLSRSTLLNGIGIKRRIYAASLPFIHGQPSR